MKNIDLTDEQLVTYQNLNDLLEINDRVAIIQPPSTGKTMINLKFLQDNKDKRVLYLTSYNTAVNDLKNKMDTYQGFGNVDVTTYSNIAKGNIPEKEYDVIVLDEYHHCGANITSQMLEKIFEKSKNAKIIGSTATPIRYLDNERDMTTEIFNDVTARNMSLAYAIKNDLIPEFTYISGLYEYDTDSIIEKYLSIADEFSEDEKRRYIDTVEELKENFYEAKNIKEILNNNLKPNGKYVVFCSTIEQMYDIIKKLNNNELDWFDDFGKINIYTLYHGNGDKENITSLRDFNKSNNDGIDLLFNINMASEALHFDCDIDGVMMLRKTMSLNLFIQQLGRGLGNTSTIFDFVCNLDNYSMYDFLKAFDHEIKGSYGLEKEKNASNEKYKVADNIRKVQEVIDKLQNYSTNQKYHAIADKIISILNERHFYDINILSDIDIEKYQINSLLDKSSIEFLNYKKKLFKNDLLPYKDIEILKKFNLCNMEKRLNNRDEEIYKTLKNRYKIKEEYLNKDRKLKDFSIEYSYYLALEYVDKYYYSKENASYDLEDYFVECLIAIHNSYDNYDSKKRTSSYKQYIERKIYFHLRRTFESERINDIEEESLDNSDYDYRIEDNNRNNLKDEEVKKIFEKCIASSYDSKQKKIFYKAKKIINAPTDLEFYIVATKLYDENISDDEIGIMFDINSNQITEYLQKYNINEEDKKIFKLPIIRNACISEAFIENPNFSARRVAEMFNTYSTTVYQTVDRLKRDILKYDKKTYEKVKSVKNSGKHYLNRNAIKHYMDIVDYEPSNEGVTKIQK